MNVEDTVRNSLMLFPSIERNRLDVYNHLFCVIGNGYEWENGELVELGENEPVTVMEAVRKLVSFELVDTAAFCVAANLDFGENDDPEESLRKFCHERNNNIMADLDMLDRIDERMTDLSVPTSAKYPSMEQDERMAAHLGQPVWQFYPLSNYSAMCCIPDDVKPDWLAAIRELYDFMEAHHELLRLEGHGGQLAILHKAGERIAELEKQVLKKC